MICWVMYDIHSNRARSKVAKCCLQAGLYRVQWSVFLGEITDHRKDELELQIAELIDAAQDKVYIFPMSRQELRHTVLLGQAFDKKLVTDQVKSLFL